MEFRDLRKQYQSLKSRIDESINEVLSNGKYINGKQVKELEDKLAKYVGVKHCITCGNGTDALTMILMAWGLGHGDAVFVPDFTFFATGEVVSFLGATPVFVDVDPITYTIDPNSLEKAIQAIVSEGKLKPKVVISVDLFGLPADYDEIKKISKKYNIKVLEDAAQGFGGVYKGKPTCSLGDAAATSFFPAKPLGCYGDGGAIFTNSDNVATYLRSIASHGKSAFKYDNINIGWNSRLDTIQAAVLLVKFDAFKEYELEDVNKVASWYSDSLNGKVIIPIVPDSYLSSWAQYTIQTENEVARTKLMQKLKNKNIPTMVYYPKPMHEQTAFKKLKVYIQCPVTVKLCNSVLSLPIDGYKEIQQINYICRTILN